MSAFMLTAKHISVLVDAKYALREKYHGGFDGEDERHRYRLLIELADANAASMNHAYPTSDNRPAFPAVRNFPAYDGKVLVKYSAVALLKAIQCFEYQSNEAPTWEGSIAAKFCDELSSSLIKELPGYGTAEWAIS
jgi:hypothetical protein